MVHGSSKIAKYLNTHPMFKTKRGIAVHEFFEYYDIIFHKRKGSNTEFWEKMDNAIWFSYDFRRITKEDCDKFLKEIIEPLWCKFYKVKTSGFFEAQLPKVPKGLLSIPSNIC
jgi:hypothetical protein